MRHVLAMLAASAVISGGAGPVAARPSAQQESAATDAVIVLDANKTYQTIIGWEAVAHAGHWSPNRDLFKATLLETAVNDLGLNRLRLEIRSGTEHSRDLYAEFLAGSITPDQYRSLWYSTVNDNRNSKSIDWAGFRFTELDNKVEEVVNPVRALMKAKGEELFVNVCYVAFIKQNGPGTKYDHGNPDEYAEFVLATYQHLQQKYGWVPDAWEVVLEPDNTYLWGGALLGDAIVTAGKRLKAAGFTPRFIAPSAANLQNGLWMFDEMMSVRGVREYLSEISYHRYGGASDENVAALAERGRKYKIPTAMLEQIGSGYEELHKDLKLGQVSAWEQYVLAPVRAGRPGPDTGGAYFTIDDTDPAHPRVVMMSRTRFLRQYFKFIRRGARRIDATSGTPAFDPVAFVNTNGGAVVVVKAESAGSLRVEGLPPATYGIKYTTAAEYDRDLPDVVLSPGGALPASIPAKGVVTIFRR